MILQFCLPIRDKTPLRNHDDGIHHACLEPRQEEIDGDLGLSKAGLVKHGGILKTFDCVEGFDLVRECWQLGLVAGVTGQIQSHWSPSTPTGVTISISTFAAPSTHCRL